MVMSGLTRHTQLRKKDVTVIKLGGAVLQSESAMDGMAKAIGYGWSRGGRIVIVNGGGREIDALCKRLSIGTAKAGGLRITTPEVLEAVQMSLSKKSMEIALSLMRQGVPAVPFPAFSAGTVLCRRRALPIDGQDLGLVGEVVSVNGKVIDALCDMNAVPVVYPLGTDDSCAMYNINADEVASSMASELGASTLLLMTDVPGIMVNSSVLKSIRYEEIRTLLANGTISDGMLPKINAAGSAVMSGVGRVGIMDGSGPDSLSAFFREGVLNGTEIQV